jgi:ubiquinone biosynthesis protein UbiJ
MLPRMPTASRRSFFSRPPLPLFALPLSGNAPLNPLDALPAAINHLLAAEPWARAQLVPHVGKTLHVIVSPFTIRLAVATDGSVVRAANTAVADTTVTLPHSAIPQMVAGGGDAALRDLRLDGDAEFAQAVSMLAKHLRWDVEEDLSKVVGDAASHRIVNAARSVTGEIKRTGERMTAGFTEYLLEENPQLVRPRAVQVLADGVRKLRDDLARLEKRLDRLTPRAAVRS